MASVNAVHKTIIHATIVKHLTIAPYLPLLYHSLALFLILQTQTAHVSLRSAPLLADFKQPSYSCPKLPRAYIDAVFPRVFDYLPKSPPGSQSEDRY